MRTDTATFHTANVAPQKSPRFVVAIIFPVGSIYITSHTGIASVPGDVLDGCLQQPSAVSQRIVPDEGRSEIGSMSFDLVDIDSQFTDSVRDQLDDGEGLRGKEVRLYVGYEGMAFSAFQLFQTQVVSGVEYDEGVYHVQCRDITREQRKEIFEPKKTTLRDSVSATATTIPVYVTTAFSTIFHGTSYSDAPSATVGYIKVEDEVIRYTGKTSDTFTGCTRGVLNTRAVEHAVDAATTADRRAKVEEYIYLELPAVKMAYAILTGIIYDSSSPMHVLPSHWHLGIATTWVRLTDFTNIGPDLWNTTVDTEGFIARFTELTKTDGKKFLESELYMLLGCYSPVYSDGTVGLKRMNHVLADAPFVVELNEHNCVEWSGLRHELDLLHNHLRVDWNWDGEEFTRRNDFIDADSVAIHGTAPIKELKFKGLHGARHTDAIVRARLDALRDRYSYPPVSQSITVLPSLNRLEVGDIGRAKLPTVRDFTGPGSSIDRSVEIQQMRMDFATGNVVCDVFGSTGRASVDSPTTDTSPLPDAYYTAQGVNINTVATVNVVGDVGVIQPGTYNLAGHADMNNASAVYYYPGDLELADGATLTVNLNTQIRVKGFFTINGDIDGLGRGKAGVADSGGVGVTVAGTPGFIGNSRGMDGVWRSFTPRVGGTDYKTVSCAFTQGANAAFPFLSLTVSGNTLLGIPSDLRGTSGGGGGKLIDESSGSTSVDTLGGTGADSGAGLAIICRGMSVGASGSINTSGDDAAATSANPIGSSSFNVYPGAGGAGTPGGFLILLDGDGISIPDIGGKFIASTGTVPVSGTTMPLRSGKFEALVDRGWTEPGSGYRDESLITAQNMANSAHRIQYVPETQTPAGDADSKPPKPAVLFVEAALESVRLRTGGVDLATIDVVQFYSSITNDRTAATLAAEGKFTDTVFPIIDQQVRYYWARTGRRTASRFVYSDFEPTDPNDGATNGPLRGTFFCPDAEFARATDSTYWIRSNESKMVISPTGGTYAGYLRMDFSSPEEGGTRSLQPRADLLPIVSGQSVSIRTRVRLNSAITGATTWRRLAFDVYTFDDPNESFSAGFTFEGQHTIIADLNALSVGVWNEYAMTVPTSALTRSLARVRLLSSLNGPGSLGGQLDIDYFQAQLDAPLFGANSAGFVPKPTATTTGQQKLKDDGTWSHDHPVLASETSASITPTNFSYPSYNVMRYGATGDGTTNDAPAFQTAINLAKRTGGEVIVPCPAVSFLLTSELDLTYSSSDTLVRGFVIRGQGTQIAATENSPSYPMIRMQHTGHGFDCTGAYGVTFENLTIGTHASTFPKTCFLLARNSGGGGSIHRFNNVRTYGSFSEAVVYNYGAEEEQYNGCQFYNLAGTANAKVIVWTQTNVRSLTSTFQTIATGVQSTLGHYVFGGTFFNVSHHANADTFYLESTALVKVYGPHMHSGDGTGGGRSLIYIDTTNGASDNLIFDGIAGEVANVPAYGIYIGDTTRTIGNWIVLGCRFPHATNMIKAHANITGSGLHFINVTNASTGTGGIDFDGTLNTCYATNVAGGITAGTLGENSIDLFSKVIELAGEARVTLRNTSGPSDEKNWIIRGAGTELYFSGFNDALGSSVTPLQIGRTAASTAKIGFQGTGPIAKPTVTGSRGGNAALASLLTALANYGLITDSSS